MNDGELLLQYVQKRSELAFSTLVGRHIDLVYAAARRQTRDPALAEDITQAVFIVLARRAGKVRSGASLPAWLLSTTRFAASNAIKLEMRRRKHERSAAEMASTSTKPGQDAVDVQIAATLDAAMMRLRDDDRSAVAMRYLQGMSLGEIGQSFGISAEAAQKRVARAVLKLRDYFAAHGIDLESAALATRLSSMSACVAPAALLPLVCAGALSAAPAGAASLAIAGGVFKSLFWTPAKFASAACVAVALLAGAVIASRPEPRTPPAAIAASATTIWMPYKLGPDAGGDHARFLNMLFVRPAALNEECGLDPSVMRTPGNFAGVVRSLPTRDSRSNSYVRTGVPDITPYRGKRIRVRGYLKTDSAERAAGLNLLVYGPNARVDAQDDMSDRAILGTTDWQRYETIADVPADAQTILIGAVLKGTGTLWWDSFEISTVGDDVPITDDRRWRIFGDTPTNYQAILDMKELRDGKPTIRVSSDKAAKNEWVLYNHINRAPQPLLGKRVRMSAMIRTENADGCRLTMRAVGTGFTTLAQDEGYGRRAARGSMGWMRYSIYLNVPADAQAISSGLVVYGKGKVWLDDVRYEIVDSP